eukprot:265129-Rhodomonas_salina.2
MREGDRCFRACGKYCVGTGGCSARSTATHQTRNNDKTEDEGGADGQREIEMSSQVVARGEPGVVHPDQSLREIAGSAEEEED